MTEEEKILREQSWSYFALVAQQRLMVINFYFVIATGLSVGMVSLYKDDSTPNLTLVGILGILLLALSLIFWLWGRRNKVFVDNAVNVLKKYAEKDISNNIKLRFPLTEREDDPPDFISGSVWPDFSNCLMYLYLLFSTLGIMGISVAIWQGLNEIEKLGWIPTIAGLIAGLIVVILRRDRDIKKEKEKEEKKSKKSYYIAFVVMIVVGFISWCVFTKIKECFQYWYFPIIGCLLIALVAPLFKKKGIKWLKSS